MESKVPKYRLVYNKLKEQLYTGKYPRGTLIPSEPVLAEEFGVSIITMRRALSMLRQEGIIRTFHGRGSEVVSPRPERKSEYPDFPLRFSFRLDEGEKITVSSPVITKLEADEYLARTMGTPVGTEVYRVARIFYINDKPCSYVTNYILKEYVPALERIRTIDTGLYTFLSKNYNLIVTELEENCCAGPATKKTAEILGIPEGTLLFEFRRRSYADGRVVEIAHARYIPELCRIHMHIVKDTRFLEQN